MGLRTAFTELVGCDVPIQLAPMGGVGTPELIAAVTDAGGMGALGAGFLNAEQIAGALDTVDAVSSGPYLVNILMPLLDREVVEVVAGRAKVVDFYHGHPDPELVELVHAGGALAGWQVGSFADAVAAVEAGCDLLVVRGVEGGGRMHGDESLWPLLVAVIDAVELPVIAAGGIGTGRGLAAALAAGAAGVRMGTRFLAAVESGVHSAYRAAVVAASAADSVLTDDFRAGWPDERSTSRVLRSSIEAARAFEGDFVGDLNFGADAFPVPRYTFIPPILQFTGAVETLPMYAGESVRFVTGVEPAGEIVRGIAEEAEHLLAALH